MDVIQNIVQNLNLTVVAVVLCALCIGGVLLTAGVHIIGVAIGLFGSLLDVFLNIVSGGPVAWCGCLLGLLGCGICAGMVAMAASILSTCGTPNAVNFCGLFGR